MAFRARLMDGTFAATNSAYAEPGDKLYDNSDAHKHDVLLCADPNCNAQLTAIFPKSEAHNGGDRAFSAHFRSKWGEKENHNTDCTEQERNFMEQVKRKRASLSRVIESGGTIRINLNIEKKKQNFLMFYLISMNVHIIIYN